MCLLFVVSGVSTNYSLKNKTNKEFIKDRAKRILVPSLIGIFAYGWISGWITNYYNDVFVGNGVCRKNCVNCHNPFYVKNQKLVIDQN